MGIFGRQHFRSIFAFVVMMLFSASAFSAGLEFDQTQDVKDSGEFLEMVADYADSILYDAKGRISKVISYDGSYDVFEYGALSGKVERIKSFDSRDDLIEVTVFYRDSVSGQLLGYNKSDVLGFFSLLNKDNDVFLKGTSDKYNVYNTFFSSLVITTDNKALDFKYEDDGNLVVKKDNGQTIVYNQSGKVIRDENLNYRYDEDGNLLAVEKIEDDRIVMRIEYEDAREKVEEDYDNGILAKKIFYLPDGNIEERYEGGKLYARIEYFDDNKRVRSIEYF